jgi:regulator of ribonuclease activity A
MNIQIADLCDDNRDKKIEVLSSKFINYGALKFFHGQIVTIKLEKSNWLLLETLRDEEGNGRILVVDNCEEFFGVVGDKLMGFAKKNNWKAIILNGYVRDTDATKHIEVGLLAIGTCPLRNFEITNSQRDIKLNFAGVTFNTGDYVYADNDGVIISKDSLL